MNWNYGDAYIRHPIESGTAVFEDGSRLKCHDIFNPIPQWMHDADLIFVDPPWNKGNLSTFYTKADMALPPMVEKFGVFYTRLFAVIKEINPDVCYVEVGKEFLPDFIMEMRKLYKHVTFYNSTYYHKDDNLCYVIRGSRKAKKPKLDGWDEEDIISWVCRNENYTCIADPCMGRGLAACSAHAVGKRFVGTELNHKRLSVTMERLEAPYTIESEDT